MRVCRPETLSVTHCGFVGVEVTVSVEVVFCLDFFEMARPSPSKDSDGQCDYRAASEGAD